MVIIISAPRDGHLSYVTKHLKTDYVRIDSGDIAEGAGLTYGINHDRVKIKYKELELNNVTGVWYRRPRNVREDLELNIDPVYEGYAYSSLNRFLEQLYALFNDANWFSDFYAIRRADNKFLQLKVARELGFWIPDTIFTSEPDTASNFVGTNKQAIVKSLATRSPLPTVENHQPAFFSQIVTPDLPLEYAGLNLAPAIFQQLIEPDYELRVAVVKSKIFATKVNFNGPSSMTIRDWRLGHSKGGLSFEAYDLPDDIAGKCIALTKKLNLNFGAIDLIRAKDGKFWFLEINPNGQWAFAEQATGQPIGKTIARFLESK